MKKRNVNSLALNKKSISKLGKQNMVKGGNTISCQPVGICPLNTNDCGTQNDCPIGGTSNEPITCQSCACGPTISCPRVGICE